MNRKKKLSHLLAGILTAAVVFSGIGAAKTGEDALALAAGKTGKTVEKTMVSSASEKGQVEVHFLDVGQGDATLILSEGHAMLIDAGNNSKGTTVQNYLKRQNVKKLDYVVGTHPDADHIGGLDVILYKFECGTVFLPDFTKNTKTCEEVESTLKLKGYQAVHPNVGDTYSLGSATFTILAPEKGAFDSANDYSIVIRLENGETSFLFAGDAEEESEEEMLSGGENLQSDVYKVSHHGSVSGTSEDFLKEVDPEYAVISCGEDNSYGHPHAEVMNLLRSEKVKVFRTDLQGTIVAVSDGKKITWNMSPDTSWISGEPTGTKSDYENAASGKTKKQKSEYVLNINTKKIHLPSCDSVEKMAEKNKKETKESLSELKKQGYTPCKKCLK